MPYAEAGRVRLYYEVHGSGGPPVMLLAGLGQALESWGPSTAALASDHRVVVMDTRGLARSDRPDVPYTGAELAGDVAAVLNSAGLDRAHLVGHSMGGMIAMHTALEHPDRVRSLTLASAYAATDDWSRRLFEVRRTMIDALGLVEHFKLSTMFVFSPRAFREMRDWMASMEQARDATPPDMAPYLRQLQFCMEHDVTGRLDQIRAPTMVVVGAEDILTSPIQGRELADAIAGADYAEVPATSHGVIWENPEVFNGLVRSFVARVEEEAGRKEEA
jgi:pimeloyl-ACP methyl ester carboxylesterase